MACRCSDIARYNRDIRRLSRAKRHADTLGQNVIYARGSVDSLKHMYKATVQATTEFANEFDKLDEGAIDNMATIKTRINEELEFLEECLKNASAEDRAHHEEENKKKNH